jgi:hypothetical protein
MEVGFGSRCNAFEAPASLIPFVKRLVAAVGSGVAEEIEIARPSHVLARIVGPRPRAARRSLRSLIAQARFEALPSLVSTLASPSTKLTSFPGSNALAGPL